MIINNANDSLKSLKVPFNLPAIGTQLVPQVYISPERQRFLHHPQGIFEMFKGTIFFFNQKSLLTVFFLG